MPKKKARRRRWKQLTEEQEKRGWSKVRRLENDTSIIPQYEAIWNRIEIARLNVLLTFPGINTEVFKSCDALESSGQILCRIAIPMKILKLYIKRARRYSEEQRNVGMIEGFQELEESLIRHKERLIRRGSDV